MGLNPDGSYTRANTWVEDRDNGIDILATRHDISDNQIAAALSLAFYKDGRAVPTQNLPMGGKRLTGLGTPVDANDSVTKNYVDSNLGISNIGDFLTTERAPGSSWLKRDGATYSKATYPALATLLGDKYGKFSGFSLLTSIPTIDTNSIAYGAGLFVAVGAAGLIYTSPTGTTWTARTSGTANGLLRIAFVNNIFMAVGISGTILTSPDGITWTVRTSGVATTLYGIAYGNGYHVVCGATATIIVSADAGATWSPKTATGFTTEQLTDAAFGNGRFVLVGGTTGAAVTAVDINDWQWSRTGATGGHNSVAFGKGKFVATASTNSVYVSTSGTGAWNTAGVPVTVDRIRFGLNNFFATAPGVSSSSVDGTIWDSHTAITGGWRGIAIGPTFALITGASGVLAKSNYAYDTTTQFMVPGDNSDNGYIKAL